jgi:hypothetical protein
MIRTGIELKDFINALNADAIISEDLLSVLVDNAKTVIEEERPWSVLRKTDTSKTVTQSNTWQTAIDLSTITDFSRFYGEEPIRLFDGDNLVQYYHRKPTDRRLEYKDVSHTFIYDDNSKNLYLNGSVPFSGTLWINHIITADDIDIASSDPVWTEFPARFLPIIGFYAVGIHKGAVDFDTINQQMLPTNWDTFNALKNAMEKWDNELQYSMIETNDPTDNFGNWRSGAINRYDS